MASSPLDVRRDPVARDLMVLAALGAVLTAAAAVATVASHPTEGAWWGLVAFGSLFSGAAAVLGWRSLRIARAARREQRVRALRLEDMLEQAWIWHADASGLIDRIRPPSTGAAADWSPMPKLATSIHSAWAAGTDADTLTLRTRLKSGAAVPPTPVRLAGTATPGGGLPAILRAQPCLDDQGRFSGYEGCLVPEAQATPASSAAPAPVGPSEQDVFVYSISHDLRAPLRVIQGFTRILREDYGTSLDRIAVDHLDRVENAASRMGTMIDALLALSRLTTQPMQRQPVNLSQLAQYVLDDLREQAPDRQLEARIEPNLVAQGDPTLLRTVLENLLGNAWKYAAGRDVTRIEFGAQRTADGKTEYVVRDNGAGFDMRYADKLFGPFQRLHSATQFEGTGVGLASVRRIIERHGGHIRGEGVPDEGACFCFTLA